MAKEPEFLAHQEWLGFVQPVGLVVSVPALLAAQAYVSRHIAPEQQKFLSGLSQPKDGPPTLDDFPRFTRDVLEWEPADLVATPDNVAVFIPSYNQWLRPTYALREFQPKDPARPWLMLIEILPAGTDLDKVAAEDDAQWQASAQARFERLLRETEVPIGLMCNGTSLRLVYAPRGENSGFATFSIADMAQVAGRPIFAALHMLLSVHRLVTLPEKQRLPAILADSRKYQNTVSTQLAQQVLAALYELVRGFQAADDQRKSELLRDVLAQNPNQVYAGLLTVLMRLVFILFAEDRGLISSHPVYSSFYSVTGLWTRLREDAGRYPDTMNSRYGAWAQLLTLFRVVYDGGSHDTFSIPARRGYLFDPDRYMFLEGRREITDGVDCPHVSDGVVFRVLNNLLILDGERLSYRALDVEHIGSVYETMMGFNLEVATGRSIAIKPIKSHGAPATINLEELLLTKPADRAKWLTDRTDQKIGAAAEALKSANTLDDLLAALDRKIAKQVTPGLVPKGAMVLQPSDERRRSGSHYTPRSLTEPIVRKTLEPILARLCAANASARPGQAALPAAPAVPPQPVPTPDQLLNLKICDIAMGSGAFLVEGCRQLGDELVRAWHAHGKPPVIPLDEDELLHARRLIAQRCLYGVDRNAMAVDLAKLSLWLATLAKDHPFTFLDHALRHGDSLVGLTRDQIARFHWLPLAERRLDVSRVEARVSEALGHRQKILVAGDSLSQIQKRDELALADEQLDSVRWYGDLVIAAFFAADNDKKRKEKREEFLRQLTTYLGPGPLKLENRPKAAEALRKGDQPMNQPIFPFHWEIEFPEVFGRENGGFDAIVGNPPFAGKNTLIAGNAAGYTDWLKAIHEESHGNADLVAHFFRRAFNLLSHDGTFGLIATNTIGQGDTRSTGLRWICMHGGTIYRAHRRYAWPGEAAVVVSVVNVSKGPMAGPLDLDGKLVGRITAYLFHAGPNDDPADLEANAGKSFQGSIVLGMGFTFKESDGDEVANPLTLMQELIAKDNRNSDRIFPYIGGEEVNESPTHAHRRYVINFGDMSEEQARTWPDLMTILENKVKSIRLKDKRDLYRRNWWQFAEKRIDLYRAVSGLKRVLVTNAQASPHSAFTYCPSSAVFANSLNVFPFQSLSALLVLQSSIHEFWARFLCSSMKDDLRYNPTDCFVTFPFPENFENDPRLESVGQSYYDFRADLMVKDNQGLTKTYNRFHDPSERSPDIQKLRDLHAEMDRAVLEAYEWTDLKPVCGFALDYLDVDEEELPADLPTATWFATAGEALAFAAKLPASGRRLPWRYRWPDEFRDEVLARLLAENQRRAKLEAVTALAAPKPPIGKGRKSKGNAATLELERQAAPQAWLPGIVRDSENAKE